MLAGSDRLEEAIEPLELAIELDPESDVSYLVLGRTLQKLEQLNRALKVTKRLLRIHPDHAQGHALRGEILHRLGRTTAAIGSFRESCRCDPGQAQVRLKLATALRDERLWEESLREFDICQQLAPSDPEILIAKADAIARMRPISRSDRTLSRSDHTFARKRPGLCPYGTMLFRAR